MRVLNVFVLYMCVFFLSACSQVQQPEFKKIQGIKVGGIANNHAKVNAEAVFNNPNAFGLTVTKTDLDVLLEKQKVGNVIQEKEINVPASSDFVIPVSANLDLGALNQDLLNSVLSVFTNKKLNMTFDGTVTVKAVGIEVGVPVSFTQELEAAELLKQSGIQLPNIKWPRK